MSPPGDGFERIRIGRRTSPSERRDAAFEPGARPAAPESPAEPGSHLRAERERQGLTIEEAASRTHIRARFLEAIESGRYDELPGPAYVRGFMRLYAQALGVDPAVLDSIPAGGKDASGRQPAGSDLQGRALNDARAHLRAAARPWWTPDPILESLEPRRRARSAALAAAAVIVLAVGLSWALSQTASPPRTAGPPLVTPPVHVALAPEPSTGEPPIEGAQPGAEPLAQPGQPKPAPSALEGEGSPAEAVVEGKAVASPSGPAVPLAATAGAAGVRLAARVQQRCWVEVRADGVRVFSRTATAGEELAWTARQSLEVRFGNAAGVELWLNGEYLGRAGAGVITRRFTGDAQALAGGAPRLEQPPAEGRWP